MAKSGDAKVKGKKIYTGNHVSLINVINQLSSDMLMSGRVFTILKFSRSSGVSFLMIS